MKLGKRREGKMTKKFYSIFGSLFFVLIFLNVPAARAQNDDVEQIKAEIYRHRQAVRDLSEKLKSISTAAGGYEGDYSGGGNEGGDYSAGASGGEEGVSETGTLPLKPKLSPEERGKIREHREAIKDRIENRMERREDIQDGREEFRNQREDIKDSREDIREKMHEEGIRDKIKDRMDRQEDIRDRKLDRDGFSGEESGKKGRDRGKEGFDRKVGNGEGVGKREISPVSKGFEDRGQRKGNRDFGGKSAGGGRRRK